MNLYFKIILFNIRFFEIKVVYETWRRKFVALRKKKKDLSGSFICEYNSYAIILFVLFNYFIV